MRVNFNYFISEAVFEFILDAVDLVATEGWRLLADYAFDPATGLWRHRDGTPEPPLSLRDIRYEDGVMTWPSHRHHEPESRLAEYLDGGARDPGPCRRGRSPRPRSRPARVGPDFEALRWFLLPEDVAAEAGPAEVGGVAGVAGGRTRWLGSPRSWGWTSGRARPRPRWSGSTDGCWGWAGHATRRTSGRTGGPSRIPATGGAALAAAVRVPGGASSRGVEVLAICGVGQGPRWWRWTTTREPVRPALTWQDRRAGAGGYGLLPRMAWLAREDPAGAARGTLAAGLVGRGGPVADRRGRDHGPGPRGGAVAGGARGRRGARGLAVPPALAYRVAAGVAAARGGGGAGAAGPASRSSPASTTGRRRCWARACALPGDAVDTGGTSGGIGIYADRPVEVPRAFLAPAPLPGRWVVGGAMAALGASVDWMRSVGAGRPLDAGRAVRGGGGGRSRAPAGSCSCRTSPASARRSSTRRRVACSSG